jgi:transposase-like protein
MSGDSPASTTTSSRSVRGLTVREIQVFLQDMYAIEVSLDLISAVTDAVLAGVTA